MRPVSSYSGRTNYARLGAQFAIFACASRVAVARLCIHAAVLMHKRQSTDDTPHAATVARAVSAGRPCSDSSFFVRQKKLAARAYRDMRISAIYGGCATRRVTVSRPL